MTPMTRRKEPACDAWQLLVQFLFVQRAHLPPVAAELELSPAQCHVLHLIEPGRPMPMGQLAETLACDASNVTGLVDRLESRGLVRRRPSVRRPAREGPGPHAERFTPSGPPARPDDRAAEEPATPHASRAAGARAHPRALARVESSTSTIAWMLWVVPPKSQCASRRNYATLTSVNLLLTCIGTQRYR